MHDSPKPPPVRVTLTMPTIRTAEEVWLIASGPDKATPVGMALSGPGDLPASRAQGTAKTFWLLDRAAAAKAADPRVPVPGKRSPRLPDVHPIIRSYRPTDLGAVYDICVRTADGGADARGMYIDDRLMGDIFAVPYVTLEPEHAHVLDDGSGTAVGYVLGTADTETLRPPVPRRMAARHRGPLSRRRPIPRSRRPT